MEHFLIDVFAMEESRIAWIGDAHFLEHLTDNDLNVFVVDINPLETIDLLNLLHKVFLELETILKKPKSQRKTAVAKVLHEIADKIHKRSLVVIFSDMFEDINEADAIFSAMQHLRHNLHEVLLFHVNHHDY